MQKTKIYKDSYQLMICIFHRTKSFPKFYRPTLGRRLEENSLDLTQFIAHALMLPVAEKSTGQSLDENSSRAGVQRKTVLLKASLVLDQMRVLFNLSKDLQILPVAGFEELTIQSQEVGRELGGLIKFTKQNIK